MDSTQKEILARMSNLLTEQALRDFFYEVAEILIEDINVLKRDGLFTTVFYEQLMEKYTLNGFVKKGD